LRKYIKIDVSFMQSRCYIGPIQFKINFARQFIVQDPNQNFMEVRSEVSGKRKDTIYIKCVHFVRRTVRTFLERKTYELSTSSVKLFVQLWLAGLHDTLHPSRIRNHCYSQQLTG